ncbi:hypothetical protein PVAG01_00517 [Phlyctema vagabunda]|uniref:DUF2231 domain-containing protein n=1 Tax=Phlyctema vagabunda TaxID=108571 RepID=A0ABR4PUH4_9HELO
MPSVFSKAFRAVFLGEFGENRHAHPVHPSTVHFPIAFLGLANVLNLVYGSSAYLSVPLTGDERNLSALALVGYATNILGIVSSVPALLTGFAELYAMVSANGLYEADSRGQKSIIPKVKTTLTHAGMNDAAIFLSIYHWYMERNAYDFRPQGHQIVLSAVALGLSFYAAYLGGDLVYKQSVGVQRMGEGAALKAKEIENAKKSN